MLRIASHLLHWITDRRCPSCGRVDVRRSARKNAFEVALLPFLLARPFRCENCNNRFYGPAFQRRVPVLDNAKAMSDLPQDYPVLVYGRREDEEPFQEETSVRVLNLRGGLITLATRVEPGQHLILINLATEEDQRCRVAFVGEQHLDRNMIGIQFGRFAQEFRDRPTHRKSNASTAPPFPTSA
jgi:ribosomal protein L37AE/L43A